MSDGREEDTDEGKESPKHEETRHEDHREMRGYKCNVRYAVEAEASNAGH